jgi:hypothetical protein
MRDIRVVNISLLTNWRWRLLDNNQAVWKDVLISKYGANVLGRVELEENCKPWYASLWWRDVCSMGSVIPHFLTNLFVFLDQTFSLFRTKKGTLKYLIFCSIFCPNFILFLVQGPFHFGPIFFLIFINWSFLLLGLRSLLFYFIIIIISKFLI